ncbi:MAG: CpsD/CapB family tyrosine-protein kinase [Candidatus Rokubacteria bacterium]|nr:CpsD/CapB family tyrosine-protein kinase [Candidatus Rokubacteria bacterium]
MSHEAALHAPWSSTRIDERLVSFVRPASVEAEQYRVLRHVVETLRKNASLQVVAVTSPGVGDGKTTTAINLAGALAQSAEARVLLADIDLRRPAVARQLGLRGSRGGLLDVLMESGLTPEDTVEHLPRFNLSVLPAGGPAAAPYELLKSSRFEALLDEARRRYDYVVLDTPPFAPVPDCRLVAKCVDGFLVVVGAHRAPRAMLAEALDLMDPAKVIGLVFNGDDARRSRYYDVYAGSPRDASWRRVAKRVGGLLETPLHRERSAGP